MTMESGYFAVIEKMDPHPVKLMRYRNLEGKMDRNEELLLPIYKHHARSKHIS